jgi:hypothetical protein
MGSGWAHKIVHACPDPLSFSAFLVGSLGIVIVVACNRLTWGLCQHNWQDHRFGVTLAPVSLSYLISSHWLLFHLFISIMSPHSQLLLVGLCTQWHHCHHLHTQQTESGPGPLMRAHAHSMCDPYGLGPHRLFQFFHTLIILMVVNVIIILYTIMKHLTRCIFWVLSLSPPSHTLMLCALAHASITWWLTSPLSHGGYLITQIFARQLEALGKLKNTFLHFFTLFCKS